MVKALGYAAACTFLLALIGAALAGRDTADHGRHPSPSTDTHAQDDAHLSLATTAQPFIGATLNLYHTDRLDLYLQALQGIKDTGFNAVQIVTPIFQTNGASPTVQIEVGPGRGPSRDDLAMVLHRAKELGLGTMLMPQVNFTDPRGNEWRGKLQPEHWAPWWDSYERAIGVFIDLAVENNADVLVVGCELLTTHKPEHQERWQQVIDQARARYHGLLTYSTTWDTYHKVGFWDRLDAIGVSAYWDLTTLAEQPDQPTQDELARRWTQIKHRLFAFAQTQDKPVLLTEVGYPSLPWALKDPWNYINSDSTPADHGAQAAGYAAFIRAWGETIHPTKADIPGGPRAAGVFFHKWDPYHDGGPDDTGYGMAGKPAQGLIRDWLHGHP